MLPPPQARSFTGPASDEVSGNSEMVPPAVIEPMPPALPEGLPQANQTAPFGPAVMPLTSWPSPGAGSS